MYEVLKYPDDALFKIATQLPNISEWKELADKLIQTMNYYNGVGLAATQCGLLYRVFSIKLPSGDKVFFDPKVIFESKRFIIDKEGCLSLPGVFIKIRRSQTIKIKAFGINGKEQEYQFAGKAARVVLHEIDHLNGRLIIYYKKNGIVEDTF